DKVLAQTADLLFDLPRGTLADRHTAEPGAYPNADAQGGKHAAQPMAHQGAQSHVQNDGKAHPCGAGVSSCRWHHTPPLLPRRQLLPATSAVPPAAWEFCCRGARYCPHVRALPQGVSCPNVV